MPRGDKIKDYRAAASRMRAMDIDVLLKFFKAMGDETRLQIVGLLSANEKRVSDLAKELSLSEPTVSHHITTLREVGLLNLRTEGTNRYYSLNTEMFARLNKFVDEIESGEFERRRKAYEQAKAAMSWIDEVEMDEKDRKVLHAYFIGDQLKSIPSKYGKLLVILRYLATRFEFDRTYTEQEVNDVLKPVHEDYAQLRRELIEQGFLGREGGGGVYWRAKDAD